MAFKWYNPRTWRRQPTQRGITITIPQQQTTTNTKTGETLTAVKTSTGTQVTSSTGQTTSVKDITTNQNIPVRRSSGGSRTTTSSPSTSIQSPVPKDTTPQEEQTFRQTRETPSAQTIQPQTKTITPSEYKPYLDQEKERQKIVGGYTIGTILRRRGILEDTPTPESMPYIREQVVEYKIQKRSPLTTLDYGTPSVKKIMEMEKRKEITPGEAKELTQVTLLSMYRKNYEREQQRAIKEFESTKIKEFESKDYQGRVDRGEDYDLVVSEKRRDIDRINKEIKDFSRGYSSSYRESPFGVSQEKYLKGALLDADIYYSDREAKKKILKQFGIGAGVGAGISAVTLGVTAKSALAGAIVTGVGTTVGIVASAGYWGVGTYRGVQTYRTSKEIGGDFSTSLARGTATLGTSLTPLASYGAGGLVGGVAVSKGVTYYKTGTFKPLTPVQQDQAKTILSREGVVKYNIQKGGVTDTQMKGFTGGKEIGSKFGTTSVRKFDVKIDTSKLTTAEAKLIGKVNLRGEVFQVGSSTGKKFTGLEFGSIKTGGIGGQRTDVFGMIQGTVGKGGTIAGVKTTIASVRGTPRIVQIGKVMPKSETIRIDVFRADGKVGFTSDQIYRGEFSRAGTIRLFESTWKPSGTQGSWTTTTQPKFTRGKFGAISRFAHSDATIKVEPPIIETTQSRTYFDLGGFSKAGQTDPTGITFTKGSGSSGMKGFGTSGTSGQVLQTTPLQTTLPAPTTTFTPQITTQTTQPVFTSIYAGTGQYETTTITGRLTSIPSSLSIVAGQDLIPQQQTTTSPIIDVGRTFSPSRRTGTIPIVGITSIVDFSPIQKPRQIQRSRLLQPSPLTTPTFSTPPFPSIKGGGFGLPIFALPFGGERAFFGGGLSAKRTYRYTPSFKAIVFGIKGRMPKQKRFTGLEVRPIVGDNIFSLRKKKRGELFNYKI